MIFIQVAITEITLMSNEYLFHVKLIDLLGREQKLLIANIDKDNMVVLHNRQNELFRSFIKATKVT